jgi:filamentous hemagglutinin family protein
MMKELRKISNKYYIRQIMACFLATCLFFGPAVYAGPENWKVIHGGPVNFAYDVPTNTWNITQPGSQAIVNYSGFNVPTGEIINFLRQGGGSDLAILNRILSANPTNIDGQINSLGKVFFVNPAGIIFGDNARINVAQMVASGLEISDDDFLDGKYIFRDGWYLHKADDGWHLNYYGGNINVNSGAQLQAAQIMLVGKSVFNDGTLTKRDADSSTYVIMGAGDTVKFFRPGSDVIIEAANPANRKIVNNGDIQTGGGQVLLGAGDIYTKAIGNLDTLTAKSLGDITVDGAINAAGDLTLFADYDHQDGGDFLSTADAPLTTEQGNIEIRGNNVDIGAAVDAGGNLTIVGRDCWPQPEDEWGNVHARSTLTAGGDIAISDTGENQEWVPGHWEDGCWVPGHWKGCWWIPGHWEGRYWVDGYWQTNYYPGTITLDGDVTAGGDIRLYNDTYTTNVTGNGVTLNAGNNIELLNSADPYENCTLLSGEYYLALVAGNEIVAPDTTIGVTGSTLLLHQGLSIDTKDYTFANQETTDLTLISDNGSVTSDMAKWKNAADKWASIGAKAYGNITLSGCGSIKLGDDGASEGASLHSTNGNICVTSHHNITANQNVIADIGRLDMQAGCDVTAYGSLYSGSNMTITAGDDIKLNKYWGDTEAGCSMNLTAGDDVKAYSDLYAGGSITIDAADDTIYLGGDVRAMGNIWLMANTKLNGWGCSQTLSAYGGSIWADGYVRKVTSGNLWMWACGSDEAGRSIDLRYISACPYDPAVSTFKGNIWLIGSDDIQISGNITTFGPGLCSWGHCPCSGWPTGGVGVLSLNGKIYTDWASPNPQEGDYMLDIGITGNSDSHSECYFGRGISNPFESIIRSSETSGGYLAIAVVSPEDLKIGPDAQLKAYGRYYDDDTVDDRGLINFLAEPDYIPTGGPLRDPGQPFDLAIYLQSTENNVDMSGFASIMSREPVEVPDGDGGVIIINPQTIDGEWQCVPKGAMVIDAYDTVTFDGAAGGQFLASLAAGQVGSRLEVCSRITEWLEDAVGRLPFPADLTLPVDYTYVMRGAGLENPDITDGRAWVLIARPSPPPLNAMQLQAAEQRAPQVEGCPAIIAAATEELGITPENIQVAMANAMASATDIQPCDTCARLVNAAAILKDVDGSRMQALIESINAIAPANIPFTPEIGTQIATTFEGHKGDGTAYASALEYVDAFVEYVKILDKEMNSPVGDSMAFVMEKHGQSLTASDNANVAAFVASRLEQIAP